MLHGRNWFGQNRMRKSKQNRKMPRVPYNYDRQINRPRYGNPLRNPRFRLQNSYSCGNLRQKVRFQGSFSLYSILLMFNSNETTLN